MNPTPETCGHPMSSFVQTIDEAGIHTCVRCDDCGKVLDPCPHGNNPDVCAACQAPSTPGKKR